MSVTATQAEIGPFVTGGDVEQALIDTLQHWLVPYLREGEDKHGLPRGDIPEPRGWAITGRDLQKFTSDQLPCVVVLAGGIVVKPLSQGYPGKTTSVWHVDVGVFFNAAWGRKSRQHAQLYVRAMSLCLVQRPLEGVAGVVDFTGEQYDEVDFAETRTYSAAVAQFTIEVENMMWRDGGPPPEVSPPDTDEPFEPWTEVAETDVEVTNTPPSPS